MPLISASAWDASTKEAQRHGSDGGLSIRGGDATDLVLGMSQRSLEMMVRWALGIRGVEEGTG